MKKPISNSRLFCIGALVGDMAAAVSQWMGIHAQHDHVVDLFAMAFVGCLVVAIAGDRRGEA